MRRLLLLLTALVLTGISAAGNSLIQPNDSIAICGDSITEQLLYSVYMQDYLLMCAPTPGQKIVQLGWSGEQAPGFLARLDSDLYPFSPTVVTTCYGMNDGHYVGITPEIADTYRKSQTAIVESLKKHGVRTIILGSSKCVDTFTYHKGQPLGPDVYNKTLAALADIDKQIAKQEGVVYADVYEATTAAMEKSKAACGQNYTFGGDDGVHPGPNGAFVMAYAFLKALGFDGAIGTLTVDLGTHQAEGSPGQKIISFQNGILTVESSRYPFCFAGSPSPPSQDNIGIVPFVPFNEELNRYMLVVKGLTSAKAKITWGATSKEFTSAQLASGINLAAEFLANPFVGPFYNVNAAIRAQQSADTTLIKNFLHFVPTFKGMFPKQASVLDSMVPEGVQNSRTRYETTVALVTPVRHTLTIEPEP